MKGLPRAPDTSRPRDLFSVLVLWPIERLTDSLRRGDAFTAQSLVEMEHLRNRLKAFDAALEDRLSLIDDEDA